jgi:hypothetical protein
MRYAVAIVITLWSVPALAADYSPYIVKQYGHEVVECAAYENVLAMAFQQNGAQDAGEYKEGADQFSLLGAEIFKSAPAFKDQLMPAIDAMLDSMQSPQGQADATDKYQEQCSAIAKNPQGRLAYWQAKLNH